MEKQDLRARLVLAFIFAGITWINLWRYPFWEVAGVTVMIFVVVLLFVEPPDLHDPPSMF